MTGFPPKSRWFSALFYFYIRRRLKNAFSDVRLLGGERLRDLLSAKSVILASNHVAWWDPLLLLHLEANLGFNGYCFMDKENLESLPFFSKLGALSLDRSSHFRAFRDLVRFSNILGQPNTLLAIFPQGQQMPAHLPLHFQPGVALLASMSSAPVVPLAIRYDFSEGPRAIVHLSLGKEISWGSRGRNEKAQFLEELQCAVTHELGCIDDALQSGQPQGVSLLGRSDSSMAKERIPKVAGLLSLRKASKYS